MLSPEGLREIVQIQSRFVRGEAAPSSQVETYLVVRSSKTDEQRFSTADEVIKQRNPKTNPIRQVRVITRGPHGNCVVSFDYDGHKQCAAVYTEVASGASDSNTAYESMIELELANLREPYSFLRVLWEPVHALALRIPVWLPFAIAVISFMLMGVVGTIQEAERARLYREMIANAEVERLREPSIRGSRHPLLEEEEGDSDERQPAAIEGAPKVTRPPITLDHQALRKAFAYWVFPLFGVVLLIYSYILYFPRVIFCIGEGSKRNDQISRRRWYWLGSAVISGVVIPAARSLAGF